MRTLVTYSGDHQLFTESILPSFKHLAKQHFPTTHLAERGFAESVSGNDTAFSGLPHKNFPRTLSCALCSFGLDTDDSDALENGTPMRWREPRSQRGCPEDSTNLSA